MSNGAREAFSRALKRITKPDEQEQDVFDEKKFMDAEWQRLADDFGVSVEELQSPEFEERLRREQEEKDKKDAAINKRESSEEWRSIRNGGIVAGIVAGCAWRLMSSRAWWHAIVVGAIFAFIFVAAQEEAIKSVRRDDYLRDVKQHWERVNSRLVNFQITFAVLSAVIFMFIWLASR